MFWTDFDNLMLIDGMYGKCKILQSCIGFCVDGCGDGSVFVMLTDDCVLWNNRLISLEISLVGKSFCFRMFIITMRFLLWNLSSLSFRMWSIKPTIVLIFWSIGWIDWRSSNLPDETGICYQSAMWESLESSLTTLDTWFLFQMWTLYLVQCCWDVFQLIYESPSPF